MTDSSGGHTMNAEAKVRKPIGYARPDGSVTPSGIGAGDILSVRNVWKSFGDTKALQGCSFAAHRGEIHAIVGENGSGKSTLAKIMSGVFAGDSGAVEVQGNTPRNPAHAKALGVSTVFQEVLLAEGMTVLDNVFIGVGGPRAKRVSKAQKIRRTTELFNDLLGKPIDPYRLVDDLPLSDRQWITIARALLHQPRVLILDESTAALDHSGTERLYEAAVRLKDEGMCVLIVTHRIEELTTFADRATVLRGGIDVGTLQRTEITEARLLELMTGESDWPGEGSRITAPHASTLSNEHATAVSATGVCLRPDSASFHLEVAAGEILGIIGLDGHGQAQFIQAVAGIAPPIQGMITVGNRQGERLRIADQKDAANARVTYISGDRKLEGIFPNMSIFENFGMPLFRSNQHAGFIRLAGVREAFDIQKNALSIRLESSSAAIGTLSGGNQQKVLIGRALAAEPQVVLLNDPTRGVDVSTKHSMYDLLRRLSAHGNAVLFLSSEIAEFIGLCHRVAVFRDGSLFTTLKGEEIIVDSVLAAMFGQPGEVPDDDDEETQ